MLRFGRRIRFTSTGIEDLRAIGIDISGVKSPHDFAAALEPWLQALADRMPLAAAISRPILSNKSGRTSGDMPIDAIKPHHVRRYLDIRGRKAKVRANRERALLSHVFNCARQWGYTDAANPCAGVKGSRKRARPICYRRRVSSGLATRTLHRAGCDGPCLLHGAAAG